MDAIALSSDDFPACSVCGRSDWVPHYAGPVRHGAVGAQIDSVVADCAGCGIRRLAESACLAASAYSDASYRALLAQDHARDRYHQNHDALVPFSLDVLLPLGLRGSAIADVGCGGGSLLDHLRGLVGSALAIEPDEGFAEGLQACGYDWRPSIADATDWTKQVDVAISIQVIEHVDDPLGFLKEIRSLLKPGGRLVLSTPNRDDILLSLMPSTFPAFFYRTQHRWMFDAASLSECVRRAGFQVEEMRFVHRYGLSNAIHWLHDKAPRGDRRAPPIDKTIDAHWAAWLESTGRADNLYCVARLA